MTHRTSLLVAVLVPVLFATTVVDRAAAQAESDLLAAQVDELFARWDKPDSPGCACAVMRDGEVVYSRAFGMANLELDVPITPQSVFQVGSVAKQFTAASIALLALRGQLSLDDDIRMYVPEMADFGDTIRIRHLIHHTSGLRSATDLRALSGWGGRDYSNNVRNVVLLSRQRTINFRPGEEYSYTNAGYYLQAEIVKRVSGKSLREFADENIFGPLGMASTHFADDYRTIVKNRVQSYAPRAQGGLQRFLRNTDYVGPSGLQTTVEDLLRWNRNFDDMTVGGPDFIELILTRGILNSGDTLNYAFGLRHVEYRGLKTVGHGGSWKGFRAGLRRFSEQRFSVAVLCNTGTGGFGYAYRVADIYLRDVFEAPATADASRPAPKAVSVSMGELEKVTGYYWNDTRKSLQRIYVQEDTLRYSRDDRKLVPLGNDRFYILDAPTERMLSFASPTPEQPRQMIEVIADGEPRVYDAVEPVSPSPTELEGYLGTYFSEELDYRWVVRITNDSLSMWDPRTWVEFAIRPIVRDVFQTLGGGFTFTFSRDGQDRVVGFTVDTQRSKNMEFVRR